MEEEKKKFGLFFKNKSVEYSKFFVDTKNQFYDLPSNKNRENLSVRYPLIKPYSFVKIYWNSEVEELLYEVQEPQMDENLYDIFKVVKGGLEELINIKFTGTDTGKLIDFLQQTVESILLELGLKLENSNFLKIMYYIYRDFIGFNQIEPLLSDYYIEDIECNGVNSPLYVVHRKYGTLKSNIIFEDIDRLTELVEKMAQKSGRYVSYSQPLLDATLPDGSRVNATYTKDITTRGPTFTIRKFSKEPWSPTHLLSMRSGSPEMFAYIWLAVENGLNIMVIGETGSGKTTFLNAFTEFIPPQARICSIEDTRELNLPHENWLPAVTRQGFNVGSNVHANEITLFDLLKETFRQNPDYVIVGEIRGEEASVLFQGMASGHSSFGTFHASSPDALVRRLTTPPINLSPTLVETLDIVAVAIHNKEQKVNIRRIKELDEIDRIDKNGEVIYNKVYSWDPKLDSYNFSKKSLVLEKISGISGRSVSDLQKEITRRALFLKRLEENKILGFKDFNNAILEYYLNPDSAEEKITQNVLGAAYE
ncbi:MAG: type II/IV secretion system ATPase subunit [Candidatus Nanoarchaeia archaeon]|nr:type II/IV secretion system ATPase subunit [Candidatus Nanoarchaeia archaeon]